MNNTTVKVYGHTKDQILTLIVMNRKEIDITMGANLRRLRHSAGMIQEQLAELIDVSQGLIPRWESGEKGIGKDVMIKLCAALNVKPHEFYMQPDTPITNDPQEIEMLKQMRTHPEDKEILLRMAKAIHGDNTGRGAKEEKDHSFHTQGTKTRRRKTA